MAKYKLRKKRNGINKEKCDLWYAEPSPGKVMTTKQLCALATQHTSLTALELQMALGILEQCLPQLLTQGLTVQLGGLGSLRLEYGSEGVKRPEDFHFRLIRRPRVVYRPSKQMRQAVKQHVSFELDGLLADEVSFASVSDYRHWQEGDGQSGK